MATILRSVRENGPVSYRIKNHLTNSVTNVHAEHLRAADVHKWDSPSSDRRIRKTSLAAPVGSDSSDTETAEEDGDKGFVRRRTNVSERIRSMNQIFP